MAVARRQPPRQWSRSYLDWLNLEPISKDPPRNIRMVKGMPMMCFIMCHQDAPPDKYVPFHARTLHPLHCAALKAYGYRMTIDHKKGPNGARMWVVRVCVTGVDGRGVGVRGSVRSACNADPLALLVLSQHAPHEGTADECARLQQCQMPQR